MGRPGINWANRWEIFIFVLHAGRGGAAGRPVPRTEDPLLGAGPLREKGGRPELLYRAHHWFGPSVNLHVQHLVLHAHQERVETCDYLSMYSHTLFLGGLHGAVCILQERATHWTARTTWALSLCGTTRTTGSTCRTVHRASRSHTHTHTHTHT